MYSDATKYRALALTRVGFNRKKVAEMVGVSVGIIEVWCRAAGIKIGAGKRNRVQNRRIFQRDESIDE